MKDNVTRYISVVLLLIYLAMQLLCVLPNDNKRQIVFLLWFACVYVTYTPIVKNTLSITQNILFYVFLIFIVFAMLYNHTIVYAISMMISYCELFSPLLMYRILRTETKAMRRFVYLAITIILGANLLTCFAFMRNSLTEYGLRNAEFESDLKGTFFTVYTFAILVPFIVYYLFRRNKEGKRHSSLVVSILGYVLCAILAYFVIKAQFMTAMVLMAIGVVFALFYERKGAKIVLPVMTVLSLLVFLNVSDDLIRLAYNNNATATALRIEELQNILTNKASEAQDFSVRQDLSQSSLQTFIKNPIVGVFYKYVDINEALKHGIGNHAEWLDTLAKYGMFGLLLLIFVIKVILRQKRVVSTNIHYVLFIILGFFNPVLSFYMTCAIFLYMPLLSSIHFKDNTLV